MDINIHDTHSYDLTVSSEHLSFTICCFSVADQLTQLLRGARAEEGGFPFDLLRFLYNFAWINLPGLTFDRCKVVFVFTEAAPCSFAYTVEAACFDINFK